MDEVFDKLQSDQPFQIIGVPVIFIEQSALNYRQLTRFINMLATDHSLNKITLWGRELDADICQLLYESLKFNQSCTTLEFLGCLIEETQWLAKLLEVNQTITTLVLRHHAVTAEDCQMLGEALKINKSLTYLELHVASIDTEGCKWLSESLKFNRTLTALYLTYSLIGAEGFKWLSKALMINQTLIKLGVDEGDANLEGFKHLMDAMEINYSLTALHFHYGNQTEEDCARRFLHNNAKRKRIIISKLIAFQVIWLSTDRGLISQLPLELLQLIIYHLDNANYLVSLDQVRKICNFALTRETLTQYQNNDLQLKTSFFNFVFYDC